MNVERSTWRVDSNVARRALQWMMERDEPALVCEIAAAIGAPLGSVSNAMTRHPDYFVRRGFAIRRKRKYQLWGAWEE